MIVVGYIFLRSTVLSAIARDRISADFLRSTHRNSLVGWIRWVDRVVEVNTGKRIKQSCHGDTRNANPKPRPATALSIASIESSRGSSCPEEWIPGPCIWVNRSSELDFLFETTLISRRAHLFLWDLNHQTQGRIMRFWTISSRRFWFGTTRRNIHFLSNSKLPDFLQMDFLKHAEAGSDFWFHALTHLTVSFLSRGIWSKSIN